MIRLTFLLAIMAAIISATGCGKEEPKTCEPGYVGENCDVPIAPSFITITRLTVAGWPMTRPNGGGWDTNGTGPDIQFVLVAEGTGQTLHTSGITNNVSSATALTVSGSWRLSPGNQIIAVYVYDDDDAFGRELIASAAYPAWSTTSGWPPTISFTREGVVYTLDLLYEQ